MNMNKSPIRMQTYQTLYVTENMQIENRDSKKNVSYPTNGHIHLRGEKLKQNLKTNETWNRSNETRTRMESNKMLDMEIIHRGARAKTMRREKEKMERKNIKTRI